jgi:Ca-activated chloride channel family protein
MLRTPVFYLRSILYTCAAMKRIVTYILLIAFLLPGAIALAQLPNTSQQKTRILFLLDGSFSMRKEWPGGTKWTTATEALSAMMDTLSKVENVEVGLRVFGHQSQEPDKNCKDTRLEVSIGPNGFSYIKKKLPEIRPKGITPLAYSLEKCAYDFGNTTSGKNILILISDGEESCEGDPCKISLILQRNNVVLKPFIIGMALESSSIAKMGCMGKIQNTDNAKEFTAALENVIEESIAKTTVQVNLNDLQKNAVETDVDMTLYDQQTGILKYNFIHTLNARGLPDTFTVSPIFNYKLQVHTIPPIIKENIQLTKFKHNIIDVDAARGELNFALQGAMSKPTFQDRIKCLVHQPGGLQTINVQKVNSKQKYLVGKYDLEILTLPRIYLDNIKVEQGKSTDVLIPAPGILTINKTFEAYGAIFVVEEKKMKKIYDLDIASKQESVALQPGKYRIVYRSKFAKTIHTTVDKEFEITSGGTLALKL